MESVHIVGIGIMILIMFYYFVISNQLERIEKKLSNIEKHIISEDGERKRGV